MGETGDDLPDNVFFPVLGRWPENDGMVGKRGEQRAQNPFAICFEAVSAIIGRILNVRRGVADSLRPDAVPPPRKKILPHQAEFGVAIAHEIKVPRRTQASARRGEVVPERRDVLAVCKRKADDKGVEGAGTYCALQKSLRISG